MKSVKEEFLQIISAYQGILHKVSMVYFKDPKDREDNLQEILYQLWKSYPGLKNKNSIGSWIYAISINTSISRVKKHARIKYDEPPGDWPDQSAVPEDDMVRKESVQELLNAIYHLDEIDKTIILLYLEERSYDEIAAIVGISKSNVGVRINRAKTSLKKHLGHLNYG